jgi:hypothetical protein
MSARSSSRTSDLAAQQVEQIVSAAQAAAEEIRRRAEVEGHDILAQANREAEAERNEARKQAIMLGEDARQEAERLRLQTQRALEGRTAAAERAAAEVLAEARALSGGLRQLGRSLEDQADRILRDVQAAHKRMQADLRVSSGVDAVPAADHPPTPARESSLRPPEHEPLPRRARANPFEDLEVPGWVASD